MKLTFVDKAVIESNFPERIRLRRAKRRLLEEKYGRGLRNHTFEITRTLTRADFPLIVEDIPEGTIVQYYSCEMGMIGLGGMSVILQVDDDFHCVIEVPFDALKKV
jgi:hypothetical protein